MIKRIAIGLITIAVFAFLCQLIYSKLNEQSTVSLSPVPFFPAEPAAFFQFKDIRQTLRHFTETNMLWSDWTSENKNKELPFLGVVNDILTDSVFNTFFGNGEVFMGLYQIDSNQRWLMVKNIFNPLETHDSKKTIQFSFCNYSEIIPPFMICSNSEILLESFKSNLNITKESLNQSEFSKNMKLSTASAPVSFSINLSNEPDDVKRFFQADQWVQMDLEYNSKEIMLSGVSHQGNKSQLFKPHFSDFTFLKSLKIDLFEELEIPLDSSKFLENRMVLSRINLIDNVQFQSHDVILMDILKMGNLDSFLISDSVVDPLHLNEESFSIEKTIFPELITPYFTNYDFNDKEIFRINNHLIITSPTGKRELIYQLEKLNQQKEEIDYLDVINKSKHPFSYHLLSNQNDLINKINIESSTLISELLVDFCSGLSWNLNRYDDRVYYSAVLYKNEKEKKDKSLLWSINLEHLTWGPFALKNHRTDSRDIIVQDSTNKIHFIGANGKLKWSKQLNGQILGNPYQIDAYKNEKFQILFNTEKSIYAVDVLGNFLESFPINLPFAATNEVVVLDYDQNKNYRLIVALENNKIYNFDLNGMAVIGWETPSIESPIYHPISHFAINGLDYIFSIQKSGEVNLYNRKGELRFQLKAKLDIPIGSDYFIEKSYNIDSTSITFENSQGGISQYLFSKESPILISDSIKNRDDNVCIHLSNNRSFYFCEKNKNSLKIKVGEDQDYHYTVDYPFEILSVNGDRNYIPVYNPKTQEMQLITKKFSLLPTFFRTSDQFCIYDINKDKTDELITILDNEFLICYQIGTTISSSN